MVAFVTDEEIGTSVEQIVEKLRQFSRPVEELHVDPANVKLHDERNIEAIAASLAVHNLWITFHGSFLADPEPDCFGQSRQQRQTCFPGICP